MEKWEKLKGFNEKQIKEMQHTRMQDFFSQVADRHPFYSRVFKDRGLGRDNLAGLNLEDLPFTTPEDLEGRDGKEGRMQRFQLAPPPVDEEAARPKKKSFFGKLLKGGSDGEAPDPKENRLLQVIYAGDFRTRSIPLVYTSYDVERIKEGGRRLFDLWGLSRDDTMVNAFSYAPHLGFWQVFYGGLEQGSTLLQSGGGRVLGTEKILTALENMEAEVLFASPLYAKHLLQAAIKFEVDIKNLTTVVLGMETASREMVERVKDLMEMAGTAGNRVLRSLSLTEVKTSWGECEGGHGLHIQPDLHLVEVVDPASGKALGEGQGGEIAITHLDARGTCLIRYRPGLLATGGISYGACSCCGTSLPRLTGELEEAGNMVALKGPEGEEVVVNLEEVTRRLDGEKTLLLWQGSVGAGEGGKPLLTIAGTWFNRDDSPAAALAEALAQKHGVDTVFTTETYTNLVNRLELETGFLSKRWVKE